MLGFRLAIFFSETMFYNILKYIMFGVAAIVFIVLFFVSAGYGRYKTSKWGPEIDSRIGWLVMECVPPILFFIFFIISDSITNVASIIFLVIWEIHYVQRAFIYPFLIRGNKTIPWSIVIMGMVFNGLNSYIQGRYLFKINPNYPTEWLWSPAFIIGCMVWITGYTINLHSDKILRHLRAPGEADYKIPYGGLFKYISCPNYFGEILEWFGWALLTWSLAGLVFAIWTAANLLPRAVAHHKWYHEKFDDYPKERKAIIPFIL